MPGPVKPSCRSCLDQRHDLYTPVPTRSANVASVLISHLTSGAAYHVISFHNLEASAKAGCVFCSRIHEGISQFWDELMIGSDMCSLTEADTYGVCIQLRPGKSLIVSWVWKGHVMNVSEGKLGPEIALSDDHWISLVQPLEFYTNEASPVQDPAFGKAKEIKAALDLQQCRDIVRPWLERCDREHPSCRKREAKLPKRVLEISTETVWLVETRELKATPYATLSHCWGSPEAGGIKFQTTKGNLAARKSGTTLADFPKTFRDAIVIAKAIGCAYIWIDSLCIVQDDKKDWEEQAMQMAGIYANSYVNIGATSSSNNQGGCLKVRRDAYESIGMKFDVEEPRRSYPLGGNTMVRRYNDKGHQYLSELVNTAKNAPPLLTRAWVYQERLLAPCTVHFAGSELIWECRTSMNCECRGVEGLDARRWFKAQFSQCLEGSNTKADILDVWLRVVEQYSKLNLTFKTDWPFALAGLATVVERHLRCRYLAGIWEADLPRALLWRNLSEGRAAASKETGFPTWSCNSRHLQLGTEDAKISYTAVAEYGFQQDPHLTITHSETSCRDGNQFGEVLSGRLNMKVVIKRGSLSSSGDKNGSQKWALVLNTASGSQKFKFWADYDLTAQGPDQLLEGAEIFGLLVGTTPKTAPKSREYVLVTASVPGRQGCYRRIGIAYFDRAKGVFDGATGSTVELV